MWGPPSSCVNTCSNYAARAVPCSVSEDLMNFELCDVSRDFAVSYGILDTDDEQVRDIGLMMAGSKRLDTKPVKPQIAN